MDLFNANDMCLPAKVYFVLAVIALVISSMTSFDLSTVVFSTLILTLWTFFLNWICSLGFKGISWALVVLPFVSFLFTAVIADKQINSTNRNNPNNLTGATFSSFFEKSQVMASELNNFLSPK